MSQVLLSYDPWDAGAVRPIIDALRQRDISFREVVTLDKGWLKPVLGREPFSLYLLVYSQRITDERFELETEGIPAQVDRAIYRLPGSPPLGLDDFILLLPDLAIDGDAFPEGEGAPALASYVDGMLKAPKAKAWDLLVSGEGIDQARAQYLVSRLESLGVRCWNYPRDAVRGESRDGAFCRSLNRSGAYAYVFSRSSPPRRYRTELAMADILSLPKYLCRGDDAPLPLALRIPNPKLRAATIDVADEDAIEKLARRVKK